MKSKSTTYKFTVILCCIMIASTLIGQNFKLGITANSGLAFYKSSINTESQTLDQELSPILNLGLISNIRIKDNFRIELSAGHNFAKRKYKTTSLFDNDTKIERYIERTTSYSNSTLSFGYVKNKFCYKVGSQFVLIWKSNHDGSYTNFVNLITNTILPSTFSSSDFRYTQYFDVFTECSYFAFEDTEIKISLFFKKGSQHYSSISPRFRLMIGFNKFFNL